MSKRKIVYYFIWLALAACLYFFENNTGTRIVALCSFMLPLIPTVSGALFSSDKKKKGPQQITQSMKTFSLREEDEPGSIRDYQPGDPVRRIHWKLSAKRGKLLLREQESGGTVEETEEKERIKDADTARVRRKKRLLFGCFAAIFLVLLLLFFLPSVNQSAKALANRLFAASEAVNAYAYAYFPVSADQSVTPAVIVLILAAAILLAVIILSGSRLIVLCFLGACVAFQTYFGLTFPAWANILLFTFFVFMMLKRPWTRRNTCLILAVIAAVSLAVLLFWPGVDAATEAASEKARDWLSRMAQRLTDTLHEQPLGENEARHTHPLSLTEGDQETRAEKEYRLVTVTEEQISMPHWVDYLKTALLLLLAVGVVILPFLPFLLLNSRRKKALDARKVFQSENVNEAVYAIFQHVIRWLEVMGKGAGNLPYRRWTEHLAMQMEKAYADRFCECTKLFEEAAYSDHLLQEEARRQALDLLSETERFFQEKADWKQTLILKYKECLWI
ncbi:MAG: DUF58 domain-containing protein [Clostridia bacterium]|nr:DUF58 domain-containing protein [Clostridia bacterium]